MLKKIASLLPLGLLMAVVLTVNVSAVHDAAASAPPGEGTSLLLAVAILAAGVAAAFTVRNVMKRKQAK